MKFLLLYTCLVNLLLIYNGASAASDNEELILTQILYRHGDRAAFGTFPTNPVPPSVWPDGYEQLTEKGMQQQYALGGYFRERYILGKPYQLLNQTYSRQEMIIQSTDIDRTLMSAYSNLAGLYPPVGRQLWNPDLKWQPIPVHTQPVQYDHLLHMEAYCPAYDVYFNNVINSDEVRNMEAKNKDFYTYIEKMTGLENVNVTSMWKLYDILLCQKCHDHGLPAWATEKWQQDQRIVYDKLGEIAAQFFDLQFNRFGEKRLRGGVLLKRMIDNMKQKIDFNISTKAYIYSAHDDTIVALLSSMNAFNALNPPYASSVLVELHKVQQQGNAADYFVKIFYRNESMHEPYSVQVPGCDANRCSLNKLAQLLQDNIPTDWSRECHSFLIFVPGMSIAGLILLPLVCIFIMLFIVVGFMVGIRKRAQRKYDALASDETAILTT